MERYICIHGHFYQPPRENPCLEEIELHESAYPYHDWNERITAECYAPNAASRILDQEGKIIDIINNYSKINFDFGPTLLSWLQRCRPDVYEAILEADRLSIKRFSGHGSAIAQAYNHMIMPLANRRDRYTQIIWGIKDFQSRFKRFPQGMWLPEAAADTETLEVLVSLDIKFTILSQRQVKRVSKTGLPSKWQDVSGGKIDPTRAYRCVLPSGRTIALFFSDGAISSDAAFGGLLNNGEILYKRLLSAFNDQRDWDQIVNIAIDGETFGHHHRFGEMALAYCLHLVEANKLAKITNYGEYLEKHPPQHLVEIFENSSWSCIHGVERWKDNCGCNTGAHLNWTQTWRKPLREAMNDLRDRLIPLYSAEASKLLKDPWTARNDFIEVILDRSVENIEGFLKKHAFKELSKEDRVRALKLLELQKNAMFMFTSCGWYFDEVSGIEATQIMQYASRAMQYAEELFGFSIEPEFLKILEKTPSNVFENAARFYEMFVKPTRCNLLRIGAHYAISSIFEEYPKDVKMFCYSIKSEIYDKVEAGKIKLAIGKANISFDITLDENAICFAVLHLGDHNLTAGVENFTGDKSFSVMQSEIKGAFERGDIPEVIRFIDKHFDGNIYSLWHLFKDEQRKITHQILQLTYADIETSYRQIYENNYAIMNFLHYLHIPLPRPFFVTSEYIVNTDLKKIFNGKDIDVERLNSLIDEAKRWSIKLDSTTIGFRASSWINLMMKVIYENPENIELFGKIDKIIEILKPLSLEMDLWEAQNLYFSVGKKFYNRIKEKADNGDQSAKKWLEAFKKMGYYLHVKV